MKKDLDLKKVITTLKVSNITKNRIDQFRIYPRESYDEIILRILSVLSTCRTEPERARSRIIILDKERNRNFSISHSSKLREEVSEKVF